MHVRLTLHLDYLLHITMLLLTVLSSRGIFDCWYSGHVFITLEKCKTETCGLFIFKLVVKQEFVRPRWPYDMRPSVRVEKYIRDAGP